MFWAVSKRSTFLLNDLQMSFVELWHWTQEPKVHIKRVFVDHVIICLWGARVGIGLVEQMIIKRFWDWVWIYNEEEHCLEEGYVLGQEVWKFVEDFFIFLLIFTHDKKDDREHRYVIFVIVFMIYFRRVYVILNVFFFDFCQGGNVFYNFTRLLLTQTLKIFLAISVLIRF